MCRRPLQEADQLPPPEVLSYGGRDVQPAFIRSFVQVSLRQPESPALCCFQFCYHIICLCRVRPVHTDIHILSWQYFDTSCIGYTQALAKSRCAIDKRFLQNQTGVQNSLDFTPELAKRIKGSSGRECATVTHLSGGPLGPQDHQRA